MVRGYVGLMNTELLIRDCLQMTSSITSASLVDGSRRVIAASHQQRGLRAIAVVHLPLLGRHVGCGEREMGTLVAQNTNACRDCRIEITATFHFVRQKTSQVGLPKASCFAQFSLGPHGSNRATIRLVVPT